MATLKTSPEANYDTGRTDGHGTEKATYRGTSYRSAQKIIDYADWSVNQKSDKDL